jgi:hypothetical protein
MTILLSRVKQKLWERFKEISASPIDKNEHGYGYVLTPQENLLPSIKLSDFEKDFKDGSGNELEGKFLAVHSSSALVANTFARWYETPSKLLLCGDCNFKDINFGKKCPTGLLGMPPNLDMLVKNESIIIGVESKFLEYLTPKSPHFAKSYKRKKLPLCEDKWWEVLDSNRKNKKVQHLDVAQLIKHYLGLRKQYHSQNCRKVLLYLFWEPVNWKGIDVFVKHRQEIKEFADKVKDTSIEFVFQSYLELWDEWREQLDSKYKEHLEHLRKRYVISI